MSTVAVLPLGLAAALLATLALQLLLTLAFALVVRRRLARRPQLALPAPPAEVVLCLRGADPSLAEALAALAAQTYPGPWRLLVVVDSLQDPAWTLAEHQIARLETGGLARWQGARLIPLAGMPEAGSLKSASLRQAFGALHGATELVALVDADAVVAPGWLEALAAGCGQPGVGAVSGNRWYAPAQGSPAGMVRAIWNGGALVLMTLLGIPWGGSLAVRRPLIASTGWRDVLATSLCEDTALPAPLARSGWRYEFRPELIALDRDDGIALRPLRRWISRQLLTARLHHPAWPLVALHGLGTWLLLLLALAALLLALLEGQLAAAGVLLAAVVAYELGCVALLLLIEAVASRALRPLAEGLPRPGLAEAWRLLRWLPLAQWVYGLATLRAALARRVEWRGVHYRVEGRGVRPLSP
ncbi:glycosyltransferase family 2 protein [Cyanobium sp. T1B-Tous]|uniref:glycosyltransferase family 2 protein n=1 Tax=Cyanobium sp. T1B-Tous TaxID=2823721 RepID=UPI0020CD6874|nr:glycosyltransferase family 2 protein [Cyanobium sp. T1B-Tous]MCP9804996.1 glycosyltransferase family 2 protein [Cyanobium sp. T1B-Tous]